MTILPIHPAENASPDALRGFLQQCQAAAARAGKPQLVSISLAVDALDPLAVLESIFEPTEPHFYTEHPAGETAVAGAEVALEFEASGPLRFAAVKRWVDETLANTIAVGDVDAPFGGPHFFAAFAFHDTTQPGEPFGPAYGFVPRWQVARAGATTTAVANLVVTEDANLDPLVERVWRAHAKFRRFEYSEVETGTAVPPVIPIAEQPHGRDAHATAGLSALGGMGVSPMLVGGGTIETRQGAYLPHWTRDGAVYSVTFRLADSLPAQVVAQWRAEQDDIEARAKQQHREPSPAEIDRLRHLASEKIERVLDDGLGSCCLKHPRVAGVVADALKHFDGSRYDLVAWCVMPNHVHAVVRPRDAESLASIVHSWKSFTAKEANRLLGQSGEFWQAEYYDHLIRDEAELSRAVEYVIANPGRAGLENWAWVGHGRDAHATAENEAHGRDAHATPEDKPHGQDAHATAEDDQHGRDTHATAQSAHAGLRMSETGDYRWAVARALERIEAGELKKIVLARALEVVAPRPFHPLEMLNGLRQRFPDCYAFSFTRGKGPSFIGATPERLVRVSRGVLETEALAGSIRRGHSASEDAALSSALLRSEKDVREQRAVLDDIVTRLSPLGVKPEYPDQPRIKRLANVQHLQTPIRATLPEGVQALDVVAAMHPTPAVGGSPREAAVARIPGLERFPRGLYAGALGWLNSRGGAEFFVGIRSALVDGANARVFAGAGIVAGSSPEKEFAETELKARAMLDAFGV